MMWVATSYSNITLPVEEPQVSGLNTFYDQCMIWMLAMHAYMKHRVHHAVKECNRCKLMGNLGMQVWNWNLNEMTKIRNGPFSATCTIIVLRLHSKVPLWFCLTITQIACSAMLSFCICMGTVEKSSSSRRNVPQFSLIAVLYSLYTLYLGWDVKTGFIQSTDKSPETECRINHLQLWHKIRTTLLSLLYSL